MPGFPGQIWCKPFNSSSSHGGSTGQRVEQPRDPACTADLDHRIDARKIDAEIEARSRHQPHCVSCLRPFNASCNWPNTPPAPFAVLLGKARFVQRHPRSSSGRTDIAKSAEATGLARRSLEPDAPENPTALGFFDVSADGRLPFTSGKISCREH